MKARRIHTFRAANRCFVFDGTALTLAEVGEELMTSIQTLANGIDEPSDSSVVELLTKAGFLSEPDETDIAAAFSTYKAQVAASPKIASMQLLISGRCNLRCTYCYAGAGAFGTDVATPFMTAETTARAMEFALRSCHPTISISLLGGEPFLNPWFVEIVSVMRDKAKAAGVELQIGVSTNGTTWREDIIECLVANNVHVGVSIDGLAPYHDANRVYSDGSGSFDVVWDTLTHLVDRLGERQVGVRYTSTLQNVDHVSEFFWEVRRRFPHIHLQASPVIADPRHPSALDLAAAKRYRSFQRELLLEELHTFEDFVRGTGGAVPVPNAAVLARSGIYSRRRVLSKCELGMNVVTITTQGDVYPCVALVDDPSYRMGNVIDGGVCRPEQLLTLHFQNSVIERQECQECWARFLCGGGCITANRIGAGGFFKTSPALCEIYMGLMEVELIRLIAVLDRCAGRVMFSASMCG